MSIGVYVKDIGISEDRTQLYKCFAIVNSKKHS